MDDAKTLDGLFWKRCQRSPDQIAYQSYERDRGWQALTWAEMGQRVARWHLALAAEALEQGERVAVLLRNGPDWVVFDQAAHATGLVTVPLYTDDRPENAAYILEHAKVRILLVQDAGRWLRLAPAIGEETSLQRVVILEPGPAALDAVASDPRVVLAMDWVPTTAPALRWRDGDPEALATIVYTSGTTGHPKGVMLSHRNILSNVHASLQVIDCFQEDLFLSFLPLSHTLERTGGYYLPMMAGASVAFARSVSQLAEDLQTIRPTVIIAVPRVFERVHHRVISQIQQRPLPVRWLFRLAVASGWRAFEHRQGRAGWHPMLLVWPLLRRKVANQVLEKLGGRLRIAVSGGAPLPAGIARIFIGLGLPLLQGYGLTETSPVISCNPLDDNIPQSVGVSLQGLELRIGEDDELLVKGPSVMLGYWKDPTATERVLGADGWLHTGDQARIVGKHLYITGRIKDILVLSNGEKVAPADMEMAIAMDPLIEQVVVLGEGHSYLTALVVLNEEQWRTLAQEQGLHPEQPDSLESAQLKKLILKRITTALHGFPGYAKVRRVTLTREPWSIDNGLLTPTMKIKRNRVLEHFRREVEEMYQMDA